MSAAQRSVDLITFEVLKNAFDSIADQMAITLMRSAYSAIVRDSLDYSTAFCDAHGRMLAQGLTTPLHLGSFPEAMRHLMARYGGRMNPGDIYALNDPYGSGGMHLPDIYVIQPIFHDGIVEGYAATLAHHTDVGGISPGSNPVHAREIYQEGLRIPLLKLYDRGQPNQTLLEVIARNTRLPDKVLGDIRAQVAGCASAERALRHLLARYGAETLRFYGDEMLAHSERLMRAAIADIPDGVYEFTDYIDGLGERPEPIAFHARVTVAGDELEVDWTGTSSQVPASINTPIPFTRSATYLVLRSLAGRGLPNNEGYMRPIRVIAPEGTIVNSVEPAPVACRGITGFRVIDTLLGALAQALPSRVPAAGEGGVSWPSIGGYQAGKPWVYVESILGTWGARPCRDGTEGMPNPGANQSNQPVEMIEAELPLRVRRYAFVTDSGGAGRFRGGLALTREYELLAEEATMTIRTDRRAHPPYGLAGGRPGSPSLTEINPDGQGRRVLPVLPMEGVQLRKGDIIRHIQAGGGGYGDPLDRDPVAVLNDVLDEKLTTAYADRHYGVIIDPITGMLDRVATDRARAARRSPGEQYG
ncbi:MAG: hydantoinase B/oxoprolinase family protein [Chloroflexota bacterium]|nr:hydantoinase B/oxoprolinase family protein [Chloroflexota bacterium]